MQDSQFTRTPESPADARFNLAEALAFWCWLAIATGLFAAVALAPRVRTFLNLRQEYVALQRKLVAEERRVDYLRRVSDALKSDPEFSGELARLDLQATGPEERIPVDPKLILNAAPPDVFPDADAVAGETRASEMSQSLVNTLADDRMVRRNLLGASAVIMVAAFTFLCGSVQSQKSPGRRPAKAWRRWLARRYSIE
jgi:hypothetical protein